MYLASKLHKEIEKHFSPDDIIGSELTYGQISRRMNKILRPLGAKGKIVRDVNLKNTVSSYQYYSFSGHYDTEEKAIPIVINAHFAPNKKSFYLPEHDIMDSYSCYHKLFNMNSFIRVNMSFVQNTQTD